MVLSSISACIVISSLIYECDAVDKSNPNAGSKPSYHHHYRLPSARPWHGREKSYPARGEFSSAHFGIFHISMLQTAGSAAVFNQTVQVFSNSFANRS